MRKPGHSVYVLLGPRPPTRAVSTKTRSDSKLPCWLAGGRRWTERPDAQPAFLDIHKGLDLLQCVSVVSP